MADDGLVPVFHPACKMKMAFRRGSGAQSHSRGMSNTEHLAIMCQIRASALRMAAETAGSEEERAEFQRMAEQWVRQAEQIARDPDGRC